MGKPKLKYENKPIYKIGEELYCIPEKKNVTIDEVNDGRDYSNQFRPDYKDGLIYDVIIDGESCTGYNWWDFGQPKHDLDPIPTIKGNVFKIKDEYTC